jgi:hypothetical protein
MSILSNETIEEFIQRARADGLSADEIQRELDRLLASSTSRYPLVSSDSIAEERIRSSVELVRKAV